MNTEIERICPNICNLTRQCGLFASLLYILSYLRRTFSTNSYSDVLVMLGGAFQQHLDWITKLTKRFYHKALLLDRTFFGAAINLWHLKTPLSICSLVRTFLTYELFFRECFNIP